jgi:hypothetical protein
MRRADAVERGVGGLVLGHRPTGVVLKRRGWAESLEPG